MKREPYEKPEIIRHQTLKEITLLSFHRARVEEVGERPTSSQ